MYTVMLFHLYTHTYVHNCFALSVQLLKLLEGLPKRVDNGVGIGLDSCVMPTRIPGVSLVQTTDLYPFVDVLYVGKRGEGGS